MTAIRRISIIFLAAALHIAAAGCSLFPPRGFSILSYNVENLFDDVHDGTEYREFVPGDGEWDTGAYRAKLAAVSEVLHRAVPGGADIVLLQEIENRNAFDTLRDEYLKGFGYTFGAVAEAGGSAIQTALLSRFPVLDIRFHRVDLHDASVQRFIMEARIDCRGVTLHVFNNHWKSKSGGARETEPARAASAAVVAGRVRAILDGDPDAEIIVAGDLNESPDEYERIGREYPTALLPAGVKVDGGSLLRVGYDRRGGGVSADGTVVLYTMWAETKSLGSYAYKGTWEAIDHFLVAPGIMDGDGISLSEFRVVDDPFLLDDQGFPRGWRGGSGYSDHLPIAAFLEIRR